MFHLLFYNLKSGCQTIFFCTLSIYFLFFGYPIKHSFSCLIYRYRTSGYRIKHSLSCLLSLFAVSLSGETLILICGILFLDVWISNESLLHVFEYTTTQWWDTRRNTLSRVWYGISQSLDIGWNTLFSVFGYKKMLQDNILDLPWERKNVLYEGKWYFIISYCLSMSCGITSLPAAFMLFMASFGIKHSK